MNCYYLLLCSTFSTGKDEKYKGVLWKKKYKVI